MTHSELCCCRRVKRVRQPAEEKSRCGACLVPRYVTAFVGCSTGKNICSCADCRGRCQGLTCIWHETKIGGASKAPPILMTQEETTSGNRGQRVESERLDRRSSRHHRTKCLVQLRIYRGFVLTRRIHVVPDADGEDVIVLHQKKLVLEAVLLLQDWKDFVSEQIVELFVLVGSEVKANAARDLSLVALAVGVLVDVLHLRYLHHPV